MPDSVHHSGSGEGDGAARACEQLRAAGGSSPSPPRFQVVQSWSGAKRHQPTASLDVPQPDDTSGEREGADRGEHGVDREPFEGAHDT